MDLLLSDWENNQRWQADTKARMVSVLDELELTGSKRCSRSGSEPVGTQTVTDRKDSATNISHPEQ